jgi:hypothetical protein
VEGDGSSLTFGVQWRPEVLIGHDPVQLTLLRLCGERGQNRREQAFAFNRVWHSWSSQVGKNYKKAP